MYEVLVLIYPLCARLGKTKIKVVLLFYMGSLLGLFALFFAKRSLLGPAEDPGMCGVIKSLENDGTGEVGRVRAAAAAAVLSWHGNATLDAKGEAEVRLPPGFLEKVSWPGVAVVEATAVELLQRVAVPVFGAQTTRFFFFFRFVCPRNAAGGKGLEGFRSISCLG